MLLRSLLHGLSCVTARYFVAIAAETVIDKQAFGTAVGLTGVAR